MGHDDPGGLPVRSKAYADLALAELLDTDTRPSLVVDLEELPPAVVYRNPAVQPEYDVFKSDRTSNIKDDHRTARNEFRNWALTTGKASAETHCFADVIWHANTVRGRWRVISGLPLDKIPPTCLPGRTSTTPDEPIADYLVLDDPSPRHHDVTAVSRPARDDDYVSFFRSWDWASTRLGPMEKWSPHLRTMVNLVLDDPQPAVLFWGPEMVNLYNEHYLTFVNVKHPQSLGKNYRQTWTELYSVPASAKFLDDLWTKARVDGEAVHLPLQTFCLKYGDHLWERIFNITLYPIIGESGETVGIYEPLREVTDQYLSQRRADTTRRVGELTATEEEPSGFFKKMGEALTENLLDVPFALIYSIDNATDDKSPDPLLSTTSHGYKVDSLHLEVHLGIKVHKDDPPDADRMLKENPRFQAALEALDRNGEPVLVELEDDPELVKVLVEDLMEVRIKRGWGDAPRQYVICPIEPTSTRKSLSGLLVIGVNTRRPYDADYQLWMKTLARYVSSSLASVLLVMEQKMIASEARKRTQDAVEMEQRALAMIEMATVGVFMMSPEGQMTYVNQAWRQITDYNLPDLPNHEGWAKAVHEEDQSLMYDIWERVVESEKSVSSEIRMAKRWRSVDPKTGQPIEGPTWVSAGVNIREIHGKKLITGSLTEISQQKWDEAEQMKMKDEALERKRQQENFIDMTSHEMRNPLSAIFQCADAIASTLQSYQERLPVDRRPPKTENMRRRSSASTADAISVAMDLAKTITLCAQHQKRIVDDVLVLSKVDANLIEITPIEVQPRVLVKNTLKMFSAELSSIGAHMHLEVDKTFSKDLAVDWVRLDPGRILQILINLCTNAIKFTAESKTREITVVMGACREKPEYSSHKVKYMEKPADSKIVDPTCRPEWGDGEELYLTIDVTDTGKGMTEEEMHSLFQRFKQASPRTHTQYGGSGLGLYIARLLSQLQGGEIGVRSVPDKGTTFAFYIKVRRTDPPAEDHRAIKPEIAISVAVSEPTSSSPIEGRGAKTVRASELHILIVEDNLVNQKVLRRQLNNLGFVTHVANNGKESLDFLQKSHAWRDNKDGTKVDLVLMDVEMPVMSGIEATQNIRQHEQEGQLTRHLPIIAITGNARHEQIQNALQAGMDGVLPKPFRVQELLEKIQGFVGSIKTGLDDEVAPP